MFSSTFWALYLAGVALILALPTIIALVKRTKDLPLILGLNALGLILPVPCWIAAMGFAVLGRGKRPPHRPVRAVAPERFPAPVRTVRPSAPPQREEALL